MWKQSNKLLRVKRKYLEKLRDILYRYSPKKDWRYWRDISFLCDYYQTVHFGLEQLKDRPFNEIVRDLIKEHRQIRNFDHAWEQVKSNEIEFEVDYHGLVRPGYWRGWSFDYKEWDDGTTGSGLTVEEAVSTTLDILAQDSKIKISQEEFNKIENYAEKQPWYVEADQEMEAHIRELQQEVDDYYDDEPYYDYDVPQAYITVSVAVRKPRPLA